MQIQIVTIERNERRNNVANVNGIDVQVIGANLTGSAKQVTWAESIIADAVRDLPLAILRKINPDLLIPVDQLDTTIANLNEQWWRCPSWLAPRRPTGSTLAPSAAAWSPT